MSTELLSSGVYPDRHRAQQPTNVCVRCSNHASICMECNEKLSEDAVNFYRESRAEGALVFFNKAIISSAQSQIAKFVVLTMWKNTNQRTVSGNI